MIKGKTILITGGTGSFGNAVLDLLLIKDVAEIRIFSRDEKKQHDMRVKYQNPRIKYFIGDVRDKESLDYAVKGADYIFHAAALKQIPSSELFPLECVKTNILGTENVLDKGIQHKVKKIICLSTDKSVYPISAMGISKAMMEKIIVAKARTLTETIISCARYGNVLASRGSVVPLFISQIKEGQDITVTDPFMTRFLMTLKEAVELVLYAFENANAGDIFVQKSPSATIGQLAGVLGEMYKSNSNVIVLGARSGDKVHETLITKEEILHTEDLGKYFRIKPETSDHNMFKESETYAKNLDYSEGYTSNNTQKLSDIELRDLLVNLNLSI